MNKTHAAQLATLMSKASSTVLITSLRILDADTNRDQVSNQARIWTIEELERRYPDAKAAVCTAFDAAAQEDQDIDYVAVLIANIPANKP